MTGALLFLLVGQLAMAVQQDAGEDFDKAAFDAAAERMLDDAGAPGMAVAVLSNGQTLHARGYGIAGPDGQPVTTQTAFQTGSITKSFVALVILQMASEGKLDLDDPVVRHVPAFRTASRSQSDRITIDHLLTHRSGLSTLDGNRFDAADSGFSGPEAAVDELAGVQLFAEPGASFQYSNANYVLLSHLIEVLDGQPFEQVLKARIFEPMGMADSFVQVPDSSMAATGYRLWFGLPRPWQPEPAAEPDRRMIGAGGVWSSIEDLARYVEAVRTRDPRIVPAGAGRLFAVKPINEQWGYAYGWFADRSREAPVFEHSGFTPGFFSLATIVPAQGRVVVVLTNMAGLAQGDLPRAVTHAALGWPPVPAAASIGARIAIWSAVTAPLGLLLLLYKTGRQLLDTRQPMRSRMRALNVGLVLALLAGVYLVFVGFQSVTGVGFRTGYVFFPDLTVTAVSSMAFALLLAAGRLALVVRGSRMRPVFFTMAVLLVGLVPDSARSDSNPSFTVLSWNISGNAFAAHPREFQALLALADPDIVLLDEVEPSTHADQLRAALPSRTSVGNPNPAGNAWYISFGTSGGRQRGVIASREPLEVLPEFAGILPYPENARRQIMQRTPESDRERLGRSMDPGLAVNGAIVLMEGRRLLVVIADLECCGNDPGSWAELKRRVEAKEIRKLVRRVTERTSVDGIVLAGDFNLVSTAIPLALLSGPYDAPDSGLIAAELYHRDGETTWTWDGRGTPFPSRALDFQMYSPGTLRLAQGIILDTEEISVEMLELRALKPDGSITLSNHRPLVVQYAWR